MEYQKKAGAVSKMIKKTTQLKDILKLAKGCKKCGKCCQHGAGFLAGNDAKKLAKHLKVSERKLKEKFLEQVSKFNTTLYRPKSVKQKGKQYGPCIFFDSEKQCTIHKAKPLHCRVSTCNQYGENISVWFHLNYFVNADDPESVRQWAMYLKTGGKNIKGGKLSELVGNKKVLSKILNYKILR